MNLFYSPFIGKNNYFYECEIIIHYQYNLAGHDVVPTGQNYVCHFIFQPRFNLSGYRTIFGKHEFYNIINQHIFRQE